MKLPPFELRVPQDLEQALAWRASLGSDAKILAGGQSLLPMMRYRMLQPHALIDISRLAELSGFEISPTVRIGAAVTHADIERGVATCPVGELLAAHAREIAFLPVRNKGTVLGSLVHADPAADWPMLFCALDGSVEIASLRGRRTVRVVDFIRGAMDTDMAVDEIAVSVSLPPDAGHIARWGRYKLTHRVGEYAMANAVVIEYEGGRWSCWSGAIDPCPLELRRCGEALQGESGRLTPARLEQIAVDEIHEARPDCDELAVARHATAVLRAVKALRQGSSS